MTEESRRPAVTTPSSRVNFVRQQGFRDADAPECELRYPALMFQPRRIGVLVLAGLFLQDAWYFAGLGVVVLWSALVPRRNPFEALYDALFVRRGGRPPVPPAPGPRRFAQGLAGILMLGIAAALRYGALRVAWGVEAFLVLAVVALVFGRFCLGSFVFHHLRGDGAFARRTAPWASDG